MPKTLKARLSAAILAAVTATSASATVLTFDNGNWGDDYGDGAGIDVQYSSRSTWGNPADYGYVWSWDYGYGDLVDVLYSDAAVVAQVGFHVSGPGKTVTLNSFDIAQWDRNGYNTQYKVFDLSYNLLFDSGEFLPDVMTHDSLSVGLSSTTGLILQFWTNYGWTGIDNISFTVTDSNVDSQVPEPQSLALALLALGAAALTTRQPTAGAHERRLKAQQGG